jgi:hypothetical protein
MMWGYKECGPRGGRPILLSSASGARPVFPARNAAVSTLFPIRNISAEGFNKHSPFFPFSERTLQWKLTASHHSSPFNCTALSEQWSAPMLLPGRLAPAVDFWDI